MKRADIVHAMNSVYGRRNLYGARSAYIARRTPAELTLLAYCRNAEAQNHQPGNVETTRIKLSFWHRARRSLMARIGSAQGKRRASWYGFDVLTRRKLSKLDHETIQVFHSWEWMPHTYAMIRDRHPEALIVRDMTIARRYDYRSGDDIMIEAQQVDRLLSPSDYVTRQLCNWGIPESKIIEIPFGVDTKLFKPATTKSLKPVRFAFTGKVSARKGIPHLLRIWKRLNLRDAELHLYGTVDPEVQQDLPHVSGVYTYGFVDIINELPKNHVFVFPSTFEGSSKSVFEALACGLPVITTPNSGTVVRHATDGYIIEPLDEVALGEAISRLYQNPRLREKMGIHARRRAEEYTWDAYVERVWDMYRTNWRRGL